jgi:hypothetical protein
VLLNEYRAQNGREPLVINWDLSEAADWFVNDMTAKNYFPTAGYCSRFGLPAHCDSYGGMPQHRISAFGYGPAIIGENAAAGFSSAQAVFNGWKASSGHNTNMLRTTWKAIGIARACKSGTTYGCYWVTDFGSVDDPTPNPNSPYPPIGGTGSATPTKTPSPTPSKTPTPSPAPTPSPSPTPTPSPTPEPLGITWEDITCDGIFLPQDALAVIMTGAGVSQSGPASQDCPNLGQTVVVDGVQRLWGDINCSGAINALDGVILLWWMVGIDDPQADPGCPGLGSEL